LGRSNMLKRGKRNKGGEGRRKVKTKGGMSKKDEEGKIACDESVCTYDKKRHISAQGSRLIEV